MKIKQMSMRKTNNSKALYNFAKKQKLKGSTSTKDLDDSLQHQQPTSNTHLPSPVKKPHHRTQSCPSINEPLKLEYTPASKVNQSQKLIKDQTVRSSGNKVKNTHRYYQSQAQLETISNAPSISIQNLSSILYRKNLKESGLKKSGAASKPRSKQFFIHNDMYSRTRIEQQIKAYELSEQLKKIEKKSRGITIKQQILQNLLQKFEQEIVPGQELMLS